LPWRKLGIQVFLLVLAITLAAGNLWVAASRSTIPMRLEDIVDDKEIRREKHPGRDDVYLLCFQSGQTLQVDEAVFDSVNIGESLHKKSWSEHLDHNGKTLQLAWSRDVAGMAWAMPLILLTFLATTICTFFRHPTSIDTE
jgi:hypothetical protein